MTDQSKNPDRDQAIANAVHAGEPYRSIAARFGISKQRVGQIARREGVIPQRENFGFNPRGSAQPTTRYHHRWVAE